MTMQAQYTDAAHTQVKVILEAGDVLGNFSGPVEFFVGMAPGNKEHDALFALVASGKAVIADYVAPPAPVPETISDRQFFQQLAIEGDITQDEALAAVQTGAIPAKLESVIAELPASDQFNAKMLLAGATTFNFSNPLTMALAAALSPPRTEDQMKALWTAASQLV
jgi:hypothetical protein